MAKYFNTFLQKLRQRTSFTGKASSKKKITEDELIKVFNELESYGKFWFFLPKDFSQNENISKKKEILKALTVVCTIIYLGKVFALLIFHGPVSRFYLGDMFNYHDRNDGTIGILAAETMLLFGSLKVFYYFKEKQTEITAPKLFTKLKYKPYDILKKEMRPEVAVNCARVLYKSIGVQLRRTFVTTILLSGILMFYYLKNTETYESSASFIIKMIWLFIGLIFIHYSVWFGFGFGIYILSSILWWQFFTESLIKDGTQLSNSQIFDSKKLKLFYLSLNKVANNIKIVNIEFWPQILLWYLAGSLICDTAITVSVFSPLQGVALKISMQFVVFGSLISMVTLNLLSAKLVQKIQSCHKLTYHIMRKHRLTLTDNFKMLSIIERFSSQQIGIYVGDTILLDYHSFLLFLLENASMLLLLISNINR